LCCAVNLTGSEQVSQGEAWPRRAVLEKAAGVEPASRLNCGDLFELPLPELLLKKRVDLESQVGCSGVTG
jgi:hypothetical protein